MSHPVRHDDLLAVRVEKPPRQRSDRHVTLRLFTESRANAIIFGGFTDLLRPVSAD